MTRIFKKLTPPQGIFWLIPFTLLIYYFNSEILIDAYKNGIVKAKAGIQNTQQLSPGLSEFYVKMYKEEISQYSERILLLIKTKFYAIILFTISLCMIIIFQMYKKKIVLFTLRDFLFFVYINGFLIFIPYLSILPEAGLYLLISAPIPLILIRVLNKYSDVKVYDNFSIVFLGLEGLKLLLLFVIYLASFALTEFRL